MSFEADTAVLAALALWGMTIFLSWWRNDPETNFESANQGSEKTDRKQPRRSDDPSSVHGWHSEEKEHHRKERIYWLTSLGMTLVIALGAGFSARYAYRAAKEAHDQVDASKSANQLNSESGRAWIGFTFTKITGAENTDKVSFQQVSAGKGIMLQVSYENFGREPAVSVNVMGVWAKQYDTKSWLTVAVPEMKKQASICVDDEKLLGTNIVFPSNQSNSVTDFVDFTGAVSAASKINVEQETMTGGGGIVFLLCVVYKAAGRVRHTSSGFLFQGKTMSPDHLANAAYGNDAD